MPSPGALSSAAAIVGLEEPLWKIWAHEVIRLTQSSGGAVFEYDPAEDRWPGKRCDACSGLLVPERLDYRHSSTETVF